MAQSGMTASPFLDALGADGPAADRAGKMELYGRFIGSWEPGGSSGPIRSR
jgi:hypothetical protein